MIDAFEPNEPDTSTMPGVVPRTLTAAERANSSRARIVVADSSRETRASIADVLEADGYDVRRVCDARALLDVVNAWSPELVIATTDLPLADVRDAAHERLVVFSKPVDLDDVRTAVMNLTARRR